MKPKGALTLLLLATLAAAQCDDPMVRPVLMDNIARPIITIGPPIALFMMVYMGMKWTMAESPEEVENARRGVIYIVIGLLIIMAGVELVYFLLCW